MATVKEVMDKVSDLEHEIQWYNSVRDALKEEPLKKFISQKIQENERQIRKLKDLEVKE